MAIMWVNLNPGTGSSLNLNIGSGNLKIGADFLSEGIRGNFNHLFENLNSSALIGMKLSLFSL